MLRIKSKDTGGSGYANADVAFALNDGGGTIHTEAKITGKAASMGEGVVATVLDALIKDFTDEAGERSSAWPSGWSCGRSGQGEVPPDGGTALQDDPDRPVFRGHGPYDYVCVECGNVLAQAMSLEAMNKRVRIKCGRCRTINVAVYDHKGET